MRLLTNNGKERNNIELLELTLQLHSRALRAGTEEMHNAYVEARNELEQRLEASPLETLVNCPKPFTAEFLTFLLVNALRNLNEAQRHNLAISLAVRDPLFSIEEYEEQLGN